MLPLAFSPQPSGKGSQIDQGAGENADGIEHRKDGKRLLARTVGADKDVWWYPEMLFTDKVHPATKGAEALYMQVLCDFPEIMQKSNV